MGLTLIEPNNNNINNLRSTTPTPADPYSLRNDLTSNSNSTTISTDGVEEVLNNSSPVEEEVTNFNNNNGITVVEIKNNFKSTSKGFTKKLFNWGSNKKSSNNNNSNTIVSGLPTRTISSPTPISLPQTIFTTTSLPLGFPSPPSSIPDLTSSRHFIPPSQRIYGPALHHPTDFIAPHLVHPNSQSLSSMSSMTSTSSFNTSYTTDDWDSSSSVYSSTTPDLSPRKRLSDLEEDDDDVDEILGEVGEVPQQRMWRVKGFEESYAANSLVEQGEELLSSSSQGHGEEEVEGEREEIDRNLTPVPTFKISSPETPPRIKRHSNSSSILSRASSSTAIFDVEYENAARGLRNSTSFHSPPASPEGADADVEDEADDDEADDEISPPRKFDSNHKKKYNHLFSSIEDDFTARVRIPSIRFEGISMDAVFAQVERQMRGEGKGETLESTVGVLGLGYSIPETKELSFKRKSPLTITTSTRPSSYPNRDLSPTDSKSSHSSLESTTSTYTTKGITSAEMVQSTSLPISSTSTKSYPRRVSSRPTPLNVAAANAVSSRNPNNYSPKRYHSAPGVPLLTPLPTPTFNTSNQARRKSNSPILAGAFNSTPWNQITYSPASYSPTSSFLGEPYTPTINSTASSTPSTPSSSTFKNVDLPQVCVLPPSPISHRTIPSNVNSTTTTTKVTKVVVLEKGRTAKKMSSRAPTFRKSSLDSNRKLSLTGEEMDSLSLSPSTSTTSTPPLSPATSFTSNISTPNLDSPTISKFAPLPLSNKIEQTIVEDDKALRLVLHLNSPIGVTNKDLDTPQTFSLTSGALQLHNTSTAAAISANKYKENQGIKSLNAMYESDDSSGQFGDAPHHLSVAKSPLTIVPTLSLPSTHPNSNVSNSIIPHSTSHSHSSSNRPPVPHRADQIHAFLLEQQRDLSVLPISKVLLTLTPSSSTSSSSTSISNNYNHSSSQSHRAKMMMSTIESNGSLISISSSASSSSNLNNKTGRGIGLRGSSSNSLSGSTSSNSNKSNSMNSLTMSSSNSSNQVPTVAVVGNGMMNGGLLGRKGLSSSLVRSGSSMMSLNESYDSEDYDSESIESHAVVCMGERISFESGVGVAM